MAVSGIPSARRKLARARYHLEQLRNEILAFREDSPYDFEVKSLGNVRWQPEFRAIVKVTQAHPIPDSWALITGDILTNARAALDHAVFPHIRSKKPDLERKLIQYPIEDTRPQFENKNRWFERPVYRVVNDSQPYRHSDPKAHPLRILRELVNMDKHRDLVIANYAMNDLHIAPSALYEVVSKDVKKVAMVPGALVARAKLRLVQDVHGTQLFEFPCEVEYAEHIELPDLGWSANLLGSMEQILDPMDALLDALEAAGC